MKIIPPLSRLKLFSALVFLLSFHASTFSDISKPNFIIILADDLGYGDIGPYGHPSIRTPHLDQMAREGMRFTDFYAASPVCTPSRAALLTGRLPLRSGMAGDRINRVLYTDSIGGLPPEEITIATALKASGYQTACIGKWHLGHLPQFMPNSHGFDYFFGLPHSNDMPPVVSQPGIRARSENPENDWWNPPLMRNDTVIEQPAIQQLLTRRYTEEAQKFIRENKDKPFFLYLAHTFPHTPLFASDDFRGKSPRGIYGDTVEELDWSTGQILQTLRDEGLAENTLVVFTSDNGPWLIRKLAGGTGGHLRDGKGGTWEGGMRVPALAWWPQTIPAATVSREITSTMDLFTTTLTLAGVPIPDDRVINGVDITPVLKGTGPSPSDTFFYYRGELFQAIRKGHFKAHFITWDGYSKVPEVYHNPPRLTHLGRDPSEQYDLTEEYPEILEQLIIIADQHTKTMIPGKPQLNRRISK